MNQIVANFNIQPNVLGYFNAFRVWSISFFFLRQRYILSDRNIPQFKVSARLHLARLLEDLYRIEKTSKITAHVVDLVHIDIMTEVIIIIFPAMLSINIPYGITRLQLDISTTCLSPIYWSSDMLFNSFLATCLEIRIDEIYCIVKNDISSKRKLVGHLWPLLLRKLNHD